MRYAVDGDVLKRTLNGANQAERCVTDYATRCEYVHRVSVLIPNSCRINST
jgi:hypothetical protein